VEESILVIRPGALGDSILSLPLLSSIRAKHPAAKITFLGNRAWKDLIPVDITFQAFDDPRWLWLFGSEEGDPGPASGIYEGSYVILNRPDTVIRNLQKNGIAWVVQTTSVPAEGKHLVEHLHEGLGLPVPPRAPALRHLATDRGREFAWIHPGSGGSRKCVPLEVMGFLAEQIRVRTGLRLAITVGEGELFLKGHPLWEGLVARTDAILLENRPIREICRELGGASLYVGNDSGMSHLAAGLGVPSTVFFMSTDPVQWEPWVPARGLNVIDLRGKTCEDLREAILAGMGWGVCEEG